jgi:5-methyltetrahydrofolate--homocysteine methyltransferase
MHEVISAQVNASADYLAINVDDFPAETRSDMMRLYVDMVNAIGRGTPVCIDSSDPLTKAAGIDQYFRTARDPDVWPMLNSINMLDPKPVLELRKRYAFKVVAMLHETVDADGVPVAIESPDQAHGLAREMFGILAQAGFASEDIFFDTAVVPIAADLEAKRAHQTMHGIRAIAADPELAGARTLIGLSNCSHMMPNRRAVNRAYLHVALEHGVTAAVLDPTVDYGQQEPGKQILGIVRDLAANDGSDMTAGFGIFTRIADYTRKYGRK